MIHYTYIYIYTLSGRYIYYTLSGRIGKVVASHAEGCNVRIPAVAELHRFILCTRRSGGTAHAGGGCDQSIGSTVSDAIVRSWLWSTATRSSPLGYFSNYCKLLIIDPTFCGSRFSIGRLLAIEDFTFTFSPTAIFFKMITISSQSF